MMDLRWPDGKVACPQCGSEHVVYLEKARVWKCYAKHPKAKFSLKTGTIFEDSPLGLDKWLAAVWLVVNCKHGISSYEMARDLGVTQKSAWVMTHRLRLALHAGASRKKRHLAPLVTEHVEPGSNLYTDALRSYGDMTQSGYVHSVIDHAENYVDGAVHTNGLENYWSLLKRSIKGTYVSVEPFHLFRYLDEQAFRFSERSVTDFDRFKMATAQIVGRRLTCAELTGKA